MDMGYFLFFITSHLGIDSMKRPMMVPRLHDTRHSFLLKPLVETQYRHVDLANEKNMFPNNKLWTPPGVSYEDTTWRVPRDSWSFFSNNRSDALHVKLEWVNM